jgi:hypothetical protein
MAFWSTRICGCERFQKAAWFHFLVFLCTMAPIHAEDPLPTGFKAERYRSLWERNPFTLVTPSVPVQSQTFNKLAVVSWLNEGGKDSVFVQDSDTNDVERVTEVPNDKGLRIIEVHAKGGKDFQIVRDFEAVISNGSEQGTIKFKPQTSGPMIASNPINPLQVNPEGGPNPQVNQQINQQLTSQMPGANGQPVAPFANQNASQNVPPQTQQTRRKRVLPSAVNNGNPGAAQQPLENSRINQRPNGQ